MFYSAQANTTLWHMQWKLKRVLFNPFNFAATLSDLPVITLVPSETKLVIFSASKLHSASDLQD